jgi:hypothetical protein
MVPLLAALDATESSAVAISSSLMQGATVLHVPHW